MMKRIFLFILVFILVPVFSFSASMEPPWKCIVCNKKYEFWYDTSRVEKSVSFIDVSTWEIHLITGQMTYRRMKFNRSNGQVAYGEAKGYKYNRLVVDTDLSKNGLFFMVPGKEEKRLFKLLQKQ